jgi:RNA polymerase sigma-70 factor (ECF subfamily)
MAADQTTYLQECLARLQGGEESARAELLAGACRRLSELTRAMLRNYRRLRRWEETDDVLQGALIRLHRALKEVTPASLRDFYRLATTQVRRELIDLTRHYFGPAGPAPNLESLPPGPLDRGAPEGFDPGDTSLEPSELAVWTDFHRQVEALAEEEREVFDLIWYQGLTFTDAATVLGVSARTVTRRWHAANLRLHQSLRESLPGS